MDNAFAESFIGSLRDECLNTNWFLSLDDARQKLGQGFKSVCYPLWRQDALMGTEKNHLHKLSDTLKVSL